MLILSRATETVFWFKSVSQVLAFTRLFKRKRMKFSFYRQRQRFDAKNSIATVKKIKNPRWANKKNQEKPRSSFYRFGSNFV